MKRSASNSLTRFSFHLSLLFGVLLMAKTGCAWAATFDVTNANCVGVGSLSEAIGFANANPGADTVSLQTDVNGVADGSCAVFADADPDTMFIQGVTEDLTIEGNGFSVNGGSLWITKDGVSNLVGECPSKVGGNIISNPLGLVRIESAVSVTVNNLRLNRLRAIALVPQDANLTLNNVTAKQTHDFFGSCQTPPIEVLGGSANVVINNSTFESAWNAGLVLGAPEDEQDWFNAFVTSFGGDGTLAISNTRFTSMAIPAVNWPGTVQMVSSIVWDAGFLATSTGDVTIVNSVFMRSSGQRRQDKIVATDNSSIVLEASTIAMSFLDCSIVCQNAQGTGLVIATQGSTIELKGSAIGIGLPGSSPQDEIFREASGGNITATTTPNPNWVQPVLLQTAADLRTILNQPSLLTDAPGLPTGYGITFNYEPVTPLLDDGGGTPGLLIDAVTAANTTNVLTSPIDGSPITEDVFGNPRTEAGGTVRNIGAVQLGLAPTLNLTATGDGSADLNWTRPLDPGSGAISGYEVCYGTGTVPDPSALGTDCENGDGSAGTVQAISNAPDTLSGQVAGLINGDTYWFLVRGINPNPGPWSNFVQGNPYGLIGTPSLSVTAACGSANLVWTQPDLGGHQFVEYLVTWSLEGSNTLAGVLTIPDYDTLSATITGLDCNKPYRFTVAVNTVDGGSGSQGTSTITVPAAAPIPALDKYGLLLLAALMLGIGMTGIRRIS